VAGLALGVKELSVKADALSKSVDERFEGMDRRFDTVDARLDGMDARIDGLETALVEQRRYTEFAFLQLSEKMDAGYERLERKLDQFIDVQLRTNDLTDRRLRALEARRR
jgi:hypothetical protein